MTLPPLLRSKRFWSALVGIIAMILTALSPDLKPYLDEIIPSIVVIVGILIGGYAVEDAIEARNSRG